MFNDLKKLNNGKTRIKILATLLIITLTFANFTLLGSYIGEAIAADVTLRNQDNTTNIEDNVFFDVYFDANDLNSYEISKDINSEDIILYALISVKGGGVLNDVKLELENSNFRLKNGETAINIGSIPSDKSVEAKLEIVAKKDDLFNLDLLDKESQIRVTGNYKNNDGEIESLNTVKNVKISWTTENITKDNNPIKLEQKFITNKIYNIDGVNKRIIQLQVSSGIENNIYPIKDTEIEINAPELAGIYPEKVIATAYSTKATNGEDSTEFGTLEESKKGQWSYNEEEHKINIKVVNTADENNNVNWSKNGEDTFIITYVYEENVDTTNCYSDISSKINLYGTNNQVVTKHLEDPLENTEEIGDAILSNIGATKSLYKSNIKIGQETEFDVQWQLSVNYAEVAETIKMSNTQDVFTIENNETINADTYYKATYINKEEFLNVLGEEGSIAISYPNQQGELTEFATINKDSETDENGNFYLEYDNNINTLVITTSKPLSEGNMSIYHKKAIIAPEDNIEQINGLKTVVVSSVMGGEDNQEIINISKETSIFMQEPKTEIGLGIAEQKVSTTGDVNSNIINITATLKTSDLKYDLYKEPVIEIELPAEVQNIKVNEVKVLNGNGLDLENYELNGNILRIKLVGEQTSYIGKDTQILVNAGIKTTKLLPTIERDILLRCTNGKDTIYSNSDEFATSSAKLKFEAEQGILLANSVSNYNGTEPEVISFKNEEKAGLLNEQADITLATVKGTIINNTGDASGEITVIGKVNRDSNINAVLKSEITAQNATIYYTQDQEVSQDSNWNNEYSENATGYKIVFAELAKGQITEFAYNLEIPANIGVNKSMILQYDVFTANGSTLNSPKVILETEQEVSLALDVKSSVENEQIVYEGQKITYNITVTNTGESTARNIQINNPVPDGAMLVDGSETSWVVEEMEAGESITKTVKVQINNLATGEENKTISNITTVTANYLPEQLTNTIINTVEKAVLNIESLSRSNISLYEGDRNVHRVKITNVSGETLNNVTVKRAIPEGVTHTGENIVSEDESDTSTWDEQAKLAVYQIGELAPNESVTLELETYVNDIQEEKYCKQLMYDVTVEYNNGMVIESKVEGDFVVKPNFTIQFTSSPEKFKPGEEAIYELNIKNNNPILSYAGIGIDIPLGLIIKNIQVLSEGNIIEEFNSEYQYILDHRLIEANQTITIKVITEVTNSFIEGEELEAEASIEVEGSNSGGVDDENRVVFSEVIKATNKIYETPEDPDNPDPDNPDPDNPDNPDPDNPDPDNPDPDNPDPDNPDPDNPDPDNPDPDNPNPDNPQEGIYKITGIAWLDDDEDGQRAEDEKLLKGILVKIKDADTNEYLVDEDGEEIYVITDENGIYRFENLKQGNYTIEFEYNKNTYKLTPVSGKDSVANIVTTEGKTIITTDIITIKDQNIADINIGLVLNEIFDLKLDKYITKVTVQNSAGTTTYNYDKEQLAKVEISSKRLAGSTVVVEYAIDVTNEGAVPGYAKKLVDYVSPDFKFSSELNPNWYVDTDNNLYSEELASEEIMPGETKQVKLILTKTMTENNTGLVSNTAEIQEDFNEFALDDKNSTPGNKEEKENDMSGADIIISISTGGPMLYIGIVIGSMLILGTGIYFINKKVLAIGREDL